MTTTRKPFRPMLAEDATRENFEKLLKERGMLLASWKIDGIRCVIVAGHAKTRSMKDIPNGFTRTFLSQQSLTGLDGELTSGSPYGLGVMQRATSAFMSQGGYPSFTFHVFDDLTASESQFQERVRIYTERVAGLPPLCERIRIQAEKQHEVRDIGHLLQLEKTALDMGYEGLIVRDPRAPYKEGRSTLKEGYMLKLKRFLDSEAVIVGFEEMMHNDNEAKLDERGFTKRSSEKAGQRPAGMLGALVVRDVYRPEWIFNIGSGFDHDLRRRIWGNRGDWEGRVVKYKYLPVGAVDAPRHPIYLGIRAPEDI